MLQASAGKLVGRAAEFGRLTRLLDQAAAGEPVVALVSGDAGMGKTRLVTEVTVAAARQGFMVLSGRCAELGDSVPYLPLADALRSASVPALSDALATRPVLGLLLPDRATAETAGGEVPGMAQQSCSARCSACSRNWPTTHRCSSSSRTCTGPTAPPGTCSRS